MPFYAITKWIFLSPTDSFLVSVCSWLISEVSGHTKEREEVKCGCKKKVVVNSPHGIKYEALKYPNNPAMYVGVWHCSWLLHALGRCSQMAAETFPAKHILQTKKSLICI